MTPEKLFRDAFFFLFRLKKIGVSKNADATYLLDNYNETISILI